jgi:vacuolar-type H+-ATPase subunit C/Vma6
MENNGIKYEFTKQEIEAMADLLKFVRMNCRKEEVLLAEIIATALNRNAIKTIFNGKSGQTLDE